MNRSLDRDKFEEWKTRFYELEGCDVDSGWPTRSTLEKMQLGYVADEVQKHNRLGKERSK